MDALKRELQRRGGLEVRFADWDPFVRGETERIEIVTLPAREVARRELQRWRAGRFPGMAVGLADAVFHRRRGYAAALSTSTRPFALAFGWHPLSEFHMLGEREVFRRTFGREPRPEMARSHQSREGLIRTIREAARVLLAHAAGTPAAARRVLAAPDWRRGVGASLLDVAGMSRTRLERLRRNVGILDFHPSAEMRALLAPYLGLPAEARDAELERRLARVERVLGITLFEVERLLAYTRGASRTSGDRAPGDEDRARIPA